MDELAGWAVILAPYLLGGLLILTRVVAMLAVVPEFGRRQVPTRVRLVLAVSLTVVFDLALGFVVVKVPEHPLTLVVLAMREIIIGAAMGFAIRLLLSAVETAGSVAGVNMGLSLNNLFNIGPAEQLLALGRLMGLIAALVFFAVDGHLMMIEALFEHLRRYPVGGATFYFPSLDVIAQSGVDFFTTTVLLASPVLAVVLITNILLAFIMRVVPSINIFGIGIGLMLIAGFLALDQAGPTIEHHVRDAVLSGDLAEQMFNLTGVEAEGIKAPALPHGQPRGRTLRMR